jgi:hypothetical protein
MESGHGIVNGHWEPAERHSRLLELVRSALEKLTRNESSQAAHAQEQDAEQKPHSDERGVAAE